MKWIRIWTEETLEGSTFEEMGNTIKNLAFRGIWFSLITLAGNSSIPGKICFTEKTGYNLNQISDKLKVEINLLKEALDFLSSKKINKIKIIKKNNEIIINVVNWKRYQTEYERQKQYRNKGFKKGYSKRLQGKVTAKGYKGKLHTDEDEDEEEDEDKDQIYRGDIFFEFSTGSFRNLLKTDIDNWIKIYNLLEVDKELLKMRDWLIKNKDKKKAHKKDWRGFITSWLDRNQKETEEKKENKKRIDKLVDKVVNEEK